MAATIARVTEQDFQDIAAAEDLLLTVMNRLAERQVTTLPMVTDYELATQATDHLRHLLNELYAQTTKEHGNA